MSYSYSACYCRECICMDLNDRARYDSSKAWCSARRQYYNPNDDACSSYFQYDESRKPISGGCYLTTIICNILGMEDHGISLECLRNFRNEYMLNHPETYVMLIEYDVIGPRIANHLMQDSNKLSIAYSLYNSHILPITNDIQSANYENAIQRYQDMTNKLKTFYHVDTTIDRKLDINIKTLGKAHA